MQTQCPVRVHSWFVDKSLLPVASHSGQKGLTPKYHSIRDLGSNIYILAGHTHSINSTKQSLVYICVCEYSHLPFLTPIVIIIA